MGRHPRLSWAQRLVRGVDVTQFPWKNSAEPTRRRVSWDCQGSGPHPGLLRRLAAKGEGLLELGSHLEGRGGPGDAGIQLSPKGMPSLGLCIHTGLVALLGPWQAARRAPRPPVPSQADHPSLRDKLSGFSPLARV